MFASAQGIEAGSTLRAAVCIVGSGAAGMPLAMEMEQAGIDTLLLEGGGIELEAASQALHRGENAGLGQFEIASTRLRLWGGTTQHWGGMCPRLAAEDFEARPHIAHSGWPFGLDELQADYDKAERLCEISPKWRSMPATEPRSGRPLGFERGPLQLSLTPWSPPSRFGTLHQARFERARHVRVLTHANVVEVQTQADGRHATRLRVRTLEGGEFFVSARFFVLATGGLEIPKLLLASNRTQTAGLGNQHDLVGRYYQDHIGLWSGVALFRPGFEAFDRITGQIQDGEDRAWYTFVPRPGRARAAGCTNFRYLLYPTPVSYEGVSASSAFIEDIAQLRMPNAMGTRIASILLDIDQVLSKAGGGWFGMDVARTASRTRSGAALPQGIAEISMEQLPNRDSRVTLSDQRDALGERMLKLDWRISEGDRMNLLRAAQLLGESLAANSVGRLYIPGFLRHLKVDEQIKIASHHMGTARMADDEKRGVVNRELRVHGVENLYLAGSAVFPTSGWANPTLSIVAMSLRLARHLLARLASGR